MAEAGAEGGCGCGSGLGSARLMRARALRERAAWESWGVMRARSLLRCLEAVSGSKTLYTRERKITLENKNFYATHKRRQEGEHA